MLDQEVNKALNKQLNRELYNAYMYLAMSAYFDRQGLAGFAKFFRKHAEEELSHAMKIYNYIIDRGGEVELYEISAPKSTWRDVAEVIEDFYKQEVDNTQNIWKIVDLVRGKGDKATENFLQWFIQEQVEEEKLASDILSKVKIARNYPPALFQLDRLYGEYQG